MPKPRVMILRAAGSNCDHETQHAWELAGAAAERVHIRRLIESPALLAACQVLTIPGGFSYGDDIAAGRIFAAQIRRHLDDALHRFVDKGKLILGICNGFQILVQSGLLPFSGSTALPQACTIAQNDPPGFQDRWIWLRAGKNPSAFLEPGCCYELPIAHGEGRVRFAAEAERQRVTAAGQDVLRYVPPPAESTPSDRPYNPNGSEGDVAGLCDETGRVLGLMPHPERFVTWTQHPCWTSQAERTPADGLTFFQRAVGAL